MTNRDPLQEGRRKEAREKIGFLRIFGHFWITFWNVLNRLSYNFGDFGGDF